MSSNTSEPIIVWAYPFSPWGRKITSYLALRNIPYEFCDQPVTLPRPDLPEIGLKYRRIPIVSVGKDLYCDTNLAIDKFENTLLSSSSSSSSIKPGLASKQPEGAALEQMLNQWAETIGFKYACQAIPSTLDAVFQNDQFLKDREDLMGREWSVKSQRKLRGESEVFFRQHVQLLETTLLSDGRPWLTSSSSDGPGLADVNVGFLYDWMRDVGGCFPSDVEEGSGSYPKFWAWVNRFRDAVTKAREGLGSAGSGGNIESKAAIQKVLDSNYAETKPAAEIKGDDPTGLKAGDDVQGYPQEYGYTHKDVGKLIGLSQRETVIETEKGTRVHHPRWLFKVEKAGEVNGD